MENCRARYLIFFQYLGTKYSGVMKTPPHQPGLGVQNYLEKALQKLKPENEACVYISSRTDTGVHALCNSAHLDLQRRSGMPPFTGEVLAQALNFNLKPEPISELNIGAMQEAMSLLVGNHDFSTFRALNSDMPFKSPVKTLQHARLEPGPESFSQRHFNRNLQFWELTFKSPSFLYRQVRRMTGALVAVGQGRLSVSQLQELLEARDSLAYPQNMCAPPTGLFLTSVEYDESDLLLDT
ncbi:hypothetical protein COCON_G00177660 [Conger conger]|uniref:tRNA pseudouridine synthase n=1 Tax=Conger conger TaxID=82655 RepID=A0A9Q1D4V6_CONCO|nr:hypothetical protein COCON_G00177660 [Conger conger]